MDWKFLIFVLCLITFFKESPCIKFRHLNRLSHNNVKFDNIDYKTYYFDQPVDHFSFSNGDLYKQRYLMADQFWNNNGGPIFFYAGNEGDIELFCNNTGLMWDWAPEFKALLIFAEHRYYGTSLPYGNDSFSDKGKAGYLSSEQALADFAVLLTNIKATLPGASSSPVIVFGGSYGGMLAAWMRMKYPNIVTGALASSAPVIQFGDLVPCGIYARIVTDDFKLSGDNCAENIRRSWDVMNRYALSDEGRAFLSNAFHLCKPLQKAEDVGILKSWLTDVWGNLAMVDYPYAANFLAPLPAWPIKAVCSNINRNDYSDDELLKAVASAAGVYANYTGVVKCIDLSSSATSNLGDLGWSFQTCTEMVMPMCSDGINDMFEPSPWNFSAFSLDCQKRWGVTPRPDWAIIEYWGQSISTATNIIFSNGVLDPWHGGGILKCPTKSVSCLMIDDAAHHLDLRSQHENDTIYVRVARDSEKTIIRKWLKQYELQTQTNAYFCDLDFYENIAIVAGDRSSELFLVSSAFIIIMLVILLLIYRCRRKKIVASDVQLISGHTKRVAF